MHHEMHAAGSLFHPQRLVLGNHHFCRCYNYCNRIISATKGAARLGGCACGMAILVRATHTSVHSSSSVVVYLVVSNATVLLSPRRKDPLPLLLQYLQSPTNCRAVSACMSVDGCQSQTHPSPRCTGSARVVDSLPPTMSHHQPTTTTTLCLQSKHARCECCYRRGQTRKGAVSCSIDGVPPVPL